MKGGLEAALARCSSVENVFKCMEANAWQRKDIVLKAVKGWGNLEESLKTSHGISRRILNTYGNVGELWGGKQTH